MKLEPHVQAREQLAMSDVIWRRPTALSFKRHLDVEQAPLERRSRLIISSVELCHTPPAARVAARATVPGLH